jgi:hypothetical protein
MLNIISPNSRHLVENVTAEYVPLRPIILTGELALIELCNISSGSIFTESSTQLPFANLIHALHVLLTSANS